MITEKEARDFIRERQNLIEHGDSLVRQRGLGLCNPDDPIGKQIADYIRNKEFQEGAKKRIERGKRLFYVFYDDLFPDDKECINLFLNKFKKGEW